VFFLDSILTVCQSGTHGHKRLPCDFLAITITMNLFLLLCFTTVASQTVLDVIDQHANLTELSTLLSNELILFRDGLAQTTERLTILAPVDGSNFADQTQILKRLQSGIALDLLTTDALRRRAVYTPTLLGTAGLGIVVLQGDLYVGGALMVESDLQASNGIVHLVDRLVEFPSVSTVLNQREWKDAEEATFLTCTNGTDDVGYTELTQVFDDLNPSYLALTLSAGGCGHVWVTHDQHACFNGVCAATAPTYVSQGVVYRLNECLTCPSIVQQVAYANDLSNLNVRTTLSLLTDQEWDEPMTLVAPNSEGWLELSTSELARLFAPGWELHRQDVVDSFWIAGAYTAQDWLRLWYENGSDTVQIATLNPEAPLIIRYDRVLEQLRVHDESMYIINIRGHDGLLHLTNHSVTNIPSVRQTLYLRALESEHLVTHTQHMQLYPEILRSVQLRSPLTAFAVPNRPWEYHDIPDMEPILENHLFVNLYSCADLTNGRQLTSVNGATWIVSIINDMPCLNSFRSRACVTQCNVLANNGILHVVDNVLIGDDDTDVFISPIPATLAPSVAPTTSLQPTVPLPDVEASLLNDCLSHFTNVTRFRRHDYYALVAAWSMQYCREVPRQLEPMHLAIWQDVCTMDCQTTNGHILLDDDMRNALCRRTVTTMVQTGEEPDQCTEEPVVVVENDNGIGINGTDNNVTSVEDANTDENVDQGTSGVHWFGGWVLVLLNYV